MKRTALLTCLLGLSYHFLPIAAQIPPPPIHTQWTYIQSALYGENGRFYQLKIVRDTLIGGKTYKKMVGGFGCTLLTQPAFVLFENGKAYQYDPATKKTYLIYDWTARVGDVLTIYVVRPNLLDSFRIRIDSVKIWTPNGEPLRVQSITRISASNWFYASRQLIEKIGANAFFFPQSNNCSPAQFGALRCYEEPARTPVKFVSYRCDSIMTRVRTSELFAERQISLSPIPSVVNIRLSLDAPIQGGFSAEVTDMLGKIVWRNEKKIEITSLEIDVNTWQSGVYLLHLTDSKGGKWSRSFVKMH